MASPYDLSPLHNTVAALISSIDALSAVRSSDTATQTLDVVQTIVDRLARRGEHANPTEPASDSIVVDTEFVATPTQHDDSATPLVDPSVDSTGAPASDTRCFTVSKFIDALRALPPDALVSAGANGVIFAHVSYAFPNKRLGDGTGPDECADVLCWEDAVSSVVPLAEVAVSLPSNLKPFNVVRLVGGRVRARFLAESLLLCAAVRPSAVVVIGDNLIAAPLDVPCVELVSTAPINSRCGLDLFSSADDRSALNDALHLARSGATSAEVVRALARIKRPIVGASMAFYRVENVLYGECDLLDAYPLMGPDIRDVVFCPVGTPAPCGSVALYETPIVESVLAAAYGPPEARVGAARRLATDARISSRGRSDAPKLSASAQRIDDFAVIASTVYKHGMALVAYTIDGCPHSAQVSALLNDVARKVDTPTLIVESESIPERQRPFAYPHIFMAKPTGHVVFCNPIRTVEGIVEFVRAVSRS